MAPTTTDTLVVRGATQLVCVAGPGETARRAEALRWPKVIAGGALVARGGVVEWVGPTSELPPVSPHAVILDATGKVVLPGLVDSHTHLLFAGTREDEFEQRLGGATYQQIAARGGGIIRYSSGTAEGAVRKNPMSTALGKKMISRGVSFL